MLLGITLVYFFLMEGGARLYYAVRNSPRFNAEARKTVVVYYPEDKTLNRIYSVEDKASRKFAWRPYVYWRRLPFRGRLITVDGRGLRRTTNETSEEDAKTKIFFFGGSAIWGTGVSDDFTIPSLLSKRLSQEGIQAFHMFNFGESAYVNTQELIALILELRQGNRPDIVLFYDGVNDIFSVYQNRKAGLPQNEIDRTHEFNEKKHLHWDRFLMNHSKLILGLLNLRDRFFQSATAFSLRNDQDVEESVVQTLEVYQRNMEIISALSRHYNFDVYFFWQPTVWSKKILAPPETQHAERAYGKFFREVHQKLASSDPAALRNNFYNLSNIFDEEKGQIFSDSYHLLGKGNEIVADTIAELLLGNSRRLNLIR